MACLEEAPQPQEGNGQQNPHEEDDPHENAGSNESATFPSTSYCSAC